MMIRRSQPNGGTFDSSLPVRPHFIFTRVDACPAVIRCQVDAPVIVLQSSGVPWSYAPNPLSPVLQIPGCTTNFFPGVIPFAPGGITIETGGPPNPGACHPSGSGHQHCVTPPPPPKLFQNSWQMAVHFEFWLKNISNKTFINDFHIRRARSVPMLPAGAPDGTIYIKSVSICDTALVCSKLPPDRWARVNWDSTNVNFRREAWWVFPPVPPGWMAPEMDIVFSLPCYAQPDQGASFEVDYECTDACAVVDSGTFRFHCPPVVKCPDSTGCAHAVTAVDDLEGGRKGSVIDVLESYPNPMGASPSTIRFSLARESKTVLRVYDAQGRMIRTLVNGLRVAGDHQVQWDGRNDAGTPVAPGAYFYQLESDGQRHAKKVIMIR